MPKRKDYLDWNAYFMTVAKASSLRSKDPNTQVGAIVVNELKQIVATGYNGFPRGISDDDFPWDREAEHMSDTKYAYVAHAELNAIVAARRDLTNCDLYVTLFPCNECAKIVIQSGIKNVYFLENKYDDSEMIKASKRLLDAAGVKYIQTPNYDINISVTENN